MTGPAALPSAESRRVRLVPVTRAHLEAFGAGGGTALQRMLGVSVPGGWPHFPVAFGPKHPACRAGTRWGNHLFLLRDAACLVGNGGFKGAPGANGVVEIGYEVAPAFRRMGLATEAVRALAALAFEDPQVSIVQAHALADDPASVGVLRKAGWSWAGTRDDTRVGAVVRWQIARSALAA